MLKHIGQQGLLWFIFAILTACSGGGAFEDTATTTNATDTNTNTNTTVTILTSGQNVAPVGVDELNFTVESLDSNNVRLLNQAFKVTVTGSATVSVPSTTDSSGIVDMVVTNTVDERVVLNVVTEDGSDAVNIPLYFGAVISTSVQNNNQPANGIAAIKILVKAQDAEGVPIVGVTAGLILQAGSFAVPSSNENVTNTAGVFEVDVTNTVAEKNIEATPVIGNYRVPQPVLLSFTTSSSTSPHSVDLTISGSPATADGNSPIQIIVIARDQSNTPIEGVEVSLSSSSGSAIFGSVRGITGNNGAFTTTVANTVTETVQVTAVAGQVASRPRTIIFNQGSSLNVGSVTTFVSGNNALANGSDAIVLTIFAVDNTGGPVVGADVSLQITQGSASSATFSPNAGQTDDLGRFITNVSSQFAGSFNVTASVGGVSSPGPVQTVNFTSSPDGGEPALVTLTISNNNQQANGQSAVNLDVVVRDSENTPLSGVDITLTSTSGSAILAAASGTTNSGGSFSTTLTNTVAGSFQITATSRGVTSNTSTVNFVGAAPSVASVFVTVTDNNQPANGNANVKVTAIARNGANQPVPNAPISIVFNPNTNGNASSAIPDKAAGETGAGGEFIVLISDTIVESFTVTMGVTGTTVNGTSPLMHFTATENTPPTSVVATVNTTTQVADGTTPVNLTVIARDASGTPISNVVVSLASTSGSALLEPASGATGSNGAFIAQITNTQSQTVTITPRAGGVQGNSVTIDFSQAPNVVPAVVRLDVINNGARSDGIDKVTLNTVIFSSSGTPIPAIAVELRASTIQGQEIPLFVFDNATGASGLTTLGGVFTTTLNSTTAGTIRITPIAGGVLGQAQEVTFAAIAPSQAASMQLLASSNDLASEGKAEGILITVLLKTNDNNPFEGGEVRFSSDSGTIQVIETTANVPAGTTDPSGRAQARLTTEGNPVNRIITITSSSGNLPNQTISVNVTGTVLNIDGANTMTIGRAEEYSISLVDSAGNGIVGQTLNVSSALGNVLNTTTPVTDGSGRVQVTLTANIAGNDTLTVNGANAPVATHPILVSDDTFVVTPDNLVDVPLNTVQNFTVSWDRAGAPQINEQINISATRGVLSSNTLTTNLNGEANFTISADNAGPATITIAAAIAGGPSTTVAFDFVATNPAFLDLQADPSTIGVNVSGASSEQSTITAVVRDNDNNLVKNQRIEFTLTDITGGRIAPASAVTDNFGRAVTIYTAGESPSASDGVSISATVAGSSIFNQIKLTVARREAFITLGTGNAITEVDDTKYSFPYTVLVTDTNGAAVSEASIVLSIIPETYYTGSWGFDEDKGVWGNTKTKTCPNEDTNRNGILDTVPSNEDLNGNGRLEPGNVATTDPTTIVTDKNGFANFNILYAQEFATWVDVTLIARTSVSGTEETSIARFNLPIAATDINSQQEPPGVISPFGLDTTNPDCQ